MPNCHTCELPAKSNEKITCAHCDKVYHRLCVNLSAAEYRSFSKTERATWNCPSCLSQPDSLASETTEDSSYGEVNANNARSIIREEIRSTLRNEAKKTDLDGIKEQLAGLKSSGSFDTSLVNDLKTKIKGARRDYFELHAQFSEMLESMTQLKTHINTLDRNLREASLEIYGLPEDTHEVLPTIVTQLAKVVSYALQDSDIVKCVRVASRDSNSSRSRSVMVKLRSARCRDELYAAVTRYNKTHPTSLNTTLLGYKGSKELVRVCEHVSPLYKSMQAAPRV